MRPPAIASILSLESVTMLKCRSKDWRNQIIMVATKITVKALVIKSFALSQMSMPTLFIPGNL